MSTFRDPLQNLFASLVFLFEYYLSLALIALCALSLQAASSRSQCPHRAHLPTLVSFCRLHVYWHSMKTRCRRTVASQFFGQINHTCCGVRRRFPHRNTYKLPLFVQLVFPPGSCPQHSVRYLGKHRVVIVCPQ